MEDKKNAAELEGKSYKAPELEYLGGQEAYNYILEKLREKEPDAE